MAVLKSATSFITSGDARTRLAKVNVLASLVVKGGSIGVQLLMVPLLLHYLDAARYGLWLTLTGIVAWFAFFDAGLGNGLRNKLAEALAQGNTQLGRAYVSTAYVALALVSGALGLTLLGASYLVDWSHILNADASLALELRGLAQVVLVCFCIQFVLKLITMVLLANQLTAFSNAINLGSNLLSLAGIFLLTKLHKTGGLLAAGWVISLAPVAVLLVAHLWLYRGRFRDIAPTFGEAQRALARPLVGLGVQFFLIQLGGLFMFYSANLVITHLLGPTEVTRYNLAWRYFDVVAMVASIMLSPLWSASTDAFHKGEMDWLRKTMARVHRLVLLFALGSAVLLAAAPWLLPLWVGKSATHALPGWPLLVSMAVFKACYIAIMPYNYLLNGLGKVRLQVWVTLITSALTVPLAIAAVRVFGLGSEGVVLAITVCFVPLLLMSRWQYQRVLAGTATGIWNR